MSDSVQTIVVLNRLRKRLKERQKDVLDSLTEPVESEDFNVFSGINAGYGIAIGYIDEEIKLLNNTKSTE